MYPIRATGAQLANRAYRAYAEATENKTHTGADMPAWDELPQPTRNAWIATAETVRHDVLMPLGTGS